MLGLAAALAATSAGCAGWRAARAREGRLKSQLDALRYPQPMDEVWGAIRRLLAEREYPLVGADAKAVGQPDASFTSRMFSPAKETRPIDFGLMPGLGSRASGPPAGLVLETDWRASERYRAEAIEDGGVRVILTKLVRDGSDPVGKPSRDVELELELARRVDPAAAERIEAAAAPPAAR